MTEDLVLQLVAALKGEVTSLRGDVAEMTENVERAIREREEYDALQRAKMLAAA